MYVRVSYWNGLYRAGIVFGPQGGSEKTDFEDGDAGAGKPTPITFPSPLGQRAREDENKFGDAFRRVLPQDECPQVHMPIRKASRVSSKRPRYREVAKI